MPPKKILLVDDNSLVRHLVRMHLESPPVLAVCDEASDGVEAIERAEESKPDLIVLDLSMPRMNGLEAAAALKLVVPSTPIILFTSYQDAVRNLELGTMGISAVISKSSSIQVLLNEIQRLAPSARAASA
jgi:DNA-binding NarL/FixJ family response regulator